MKKVISILLTIALLFSCGIIIANADDTAAGKITPALRDAAAALADGGTVDLVVYFAGETDYISDMPAWDPSPDATSQSTHDASLQHAKYIAEHNAEQARRIFAACKDYPTYTDRKTGKVYYTEVDFTLDGCCTAKRFDPADLDAICASPLVKAVDLYPGYDGKTDPELTAVLKAAGPDDYIEIYVDRAGYYKSVDEMPSWPSGGTREEMQEKVAAARREYAAYEKEIGGAFCAEAFEGVEVRYLFQGGNMVLAAVKAGDIETIASRGCVRRIGYFYNAIAENESGVEPAPNAKIDEKLLEKLDETENVSTLLPVFIELNIDAKTIKEMPSYPNVQKAEREYDQYFGTLGEQYNEALSALKETTRLEDVRYVCCDALTATVSNDINVLNSLAESSWVKSIAYFESGDEWQTDHSRYDKINNITRYRDRFISQYHAELDPYSGCNLYQELLYHPCADSDREYENDWALVMGSYGTIVACAEYQQVVGGRLIWAPSTFQAPFTFDIGIYDAEQDRFFDITQIDFDSYDGLYEIWQALDIGTLTEMEQIGDADGDLSVTIMDATRIQRRVADLCSRSEIVATGADADSDGAITILDATRIQRYKAELCELDGTPFGSDGDDYEVGSLLVKASTGEPRSIARARNTVLSALDGFEIASIGMLASTEVSATFRVDLAQKTKENDRRAMTALGNKTDVISAAPYRGELSRYEADGFEPGRVIVSGAGYGELLKDFEIEETRLLTPGSGRSVYLIIFREKTKEIVWRALEILENSPLIEYADPDYYMYADV